jgi:hypothetical protein
MIDSSPSYAFLLPLRGFRSNAYACVVRRIQSLTDSINLTAPFLGRRDLSPDAYLSGLPRVTD